MKDNAKSVNLYRELDSLAHAWQGRLTFGLSPSALMRAYFDWVIHLANAPGKQFELIEGSLLSAMRCWMYCVQAIVDPECPACEQPLPQDKRFIGEGWQQWPYNVICQSFLLIQRWWENAATDVPGVSLHNQRLISFAARQYLDIFAPTNFLTTNPEVLRVTGEQAGANILRGFFNLMEDWQRYINRKPPVGTEDFKVGKNLGITPGKVIFRNRLIELIQYSPSTKNVYLEPIMIIPAWIMKYYILDLSPQNSLVKYLVDKGHTVFMISWKNPGTEDRDLGMADYLNLGIMTGIDVISTVLPETKINAMGYCLGGTLLTIAAAAMSRNGDERLRSLTLLAAQTDFTEAGELMLFIDESQMNYLEDVMREQGYLDTKQMAGAFQLLRSKDLIWSRVIQDYLLGERKPMFDLMAWNADATRMPFRMHSEYLRRLFLNNNLFEGRYEVDGRPIAISDIHIPVFLVATIKDHVAPWRSVYKFNLPSDAEELTFVLTSGGHNAGILSYPSHPYRRYQISTKKEGEKYIDPETWLKTTPVIKGSWWIPWQEWLAERSSGQVPPPLMGAPKKGYTPLDDAPGSYVLEE